MKPVVSATQDPEANLPLTMSLVPFKVTNFCDNCYKEKKRNDHFLLQIRPNINLELNSKKWITSVLY